MINIKSVIIIFCVNYLNAQSTGKRMVFHNGKWKSAGEIPENTERLLNTNTFLQVYLTIGQMWNQKVVIA